MKHRVHLNSITSTSMMPIKARINVPMPNHASSACDMVLLKSSANQIMVNTRINIITTSAPMAMPRHVSREQQMPSGVVVAQAIGSGAISGLFRNGQTPSGQSRTSFIYLFSSFFSLFLHSKIFQPQAGRQNVHRTHLHAATNAIIMAIKASEPPAVAKPPFKEGSPAPHRSMIPPAKAKAVAKTAKIAVAHIRPRHVSVPHRFTPGQPGSLLTSVTTVDIDFFLLSFFLSCLLFFIRRNNYISNSFAYSALERRLKSVT